MTFCPHLGSFFAGCFFFYYVSAKFHLWPSSADFTATSDRNAKSCNRIPSNYCLPYGDTVTRLGIPIRGRGKIS